MGRAVVLDCSCSLSLSPSYSPSLSFWNWLHSQVGIPYKKADGSQWIQAFSTQNSGWAVKIFFPATPGKARDPGVVLISPRMNQSLWSAACKLWLASLKHRHNFRARSYLHLDWGLRLEKGWVLIAVGPLIPNKWNDTGTNVYSLNHLTTRFWEHFS